MAAPTKVKLTPEEKIAGRKFRDDQQAALLESHETDPPTYVAPNFLSHWRHECPGRRMISTAIELKEKYVSSPAYWVGTSDDSVTRAVLEGELPEDWALNAEIPAGRFGFIYREGKCKSKGCGHTARSKAGRLVDAYDRPPVEGRVARQSQ